MPRKYVYKIDSVQAELLLRVYSARFPEVVAWVERTVKKILAENASKHGSKQ